MEVSDILNFREKRVNFQNHHMLLNAYNILTLRINYPGIVKSNKISKKIFKVIKSEILYELNTNKIFYNIIFFTYNSPEGPIFILKFKDECIKIKYITCNIENNHILGRFADIDIYSNLTLKPISRSEIGFPQRKCYLCNDFAHLCIRSRKHKLKEVENYIINACKNY